MGKLMDRDLKQLPAKIYSWAAKRKTIPHILPHLKIIQNNHCAAAPPPVDQQFMKNKIKPAAGQPKSGRPKLGKRTSDAKITYGRRSGITSRTAASIRCLSLERVRPEPPDHASIIGEWIGFFRLGSHDSRVDGRNSPVTHSCCLISHLKKAPDRTHCPRDFHGLRNLFVKNWPGGYTIPQGVGRNLTGDAAKYTSGRRLF